MNNESKTLSRRSSRRRTFVTLAALALFVMAILGVAVPKFDLTQPSGSPTGELITPSDAIDQLRGLDDEMSVLHLGYEVEQLNCPNGAKQYRVTAYTWWYIPVSSGHSDCDGSSFTRD